MVFALTSGKTKEEVPRVEMSGRHVIAFAWNGRPLVVLNIADGAHTTAVSAVEGELYAIYLWPVSQIVRAELPDVSASKG